MLLIDDKLPNNKGTLRELSAKLTERVLSLPFFLFANAGLNPKPPMPAKGWKDRFDAVRSFSMFVLQLCGASAPLDH